MPPRIAFEIVEVLESGTFDEFVAAVFQHIDKGTKMNRSLFAAALIALAVAACGKKEEVVAPAAEAAAPAAAPAVAAAPAADAAAPAAAPAADAAAPAAAPAAEAKQ